MSEGATPRWTGGGWVLPGAPGDTPVIDAHYHIFPRLGSQPRGIPTALRLKFWQYHSREWVDFWRTDTGEHVTDPLLEFGSHSIADMPDVGFHLTDHGQAEIAVGGVGYRMQIYPPSLTNNEATPERMVGEMDLAGVDAGVLQSDHVYGDLNEYYADAAARYPGRFFALAQIWEPEADDTDRLARLRAGFDELGMRGLYFSVEPLSVMQVDRSLDDPTFDALWRLVEERALPVFWFLDDRALDRVGMFMRRVAELDEWTRRHPDVPCVITHGLVPAAISHRIRVPEKLLRVLEERQVMRVGGSRMIDVDFRLLAATNRNLEQAVAEGAFREDLYYRLKVVTLTIPPLRERLDDLPLLANHFLREFAAREAKPEMRLSGRALKCLSEQRWPGNVRELRNVLETVAVFHDGGRIEVGDLPDEVRSAASIPTESPVQSPFGEPRTMAEIERQAILETLGRTGGKRAQAARVLGIGVRTLQRKLKDYREQGLLGEGEA